jgi:hypothetical protein
MEHVLGTMWFCALCFVAGAVIGPKLWAWVTGYFPWNR